MQEFGYIASKRLAFYSSSKPKPNEFTVLVRGVPKSSTESLSETVEKFFSECYPTLYLSHYMIYNTSKIWKLLVSQLLKLLHDPIIDILDPLNSFSCYN